MRFPGRTLAVPVVVLGIGALGAACSDSGAAVLEPSPPPEVGLVDVSAGVHRFDVVDRCGDPSGTGIALVDSSDGDVVWQQSTDRPGVVLADPGDDAMYVAHTSQNELPSVVRYEVASGLPEWQRFFAGDGVVPVGTTDDLVVVDRRGPDRILLGLDAATGEVAWRSPEVPRDARQGRYRLVGGVVTNDRWTVDASTGEVVDGPGAPPGPTVVGVDGGFVVADGDMVSDLLPEARQASLAVVTDATVVVSLARPRGVAAIDRSTGAISWYRPGALAPRSVGDLVLVRAGTDDRPLLALDPVAGHEQWRADGVQQVLATGDSILLTLTENGRMRTLVQDTGVVLADIESDRDLGGSFVAIGDYVVHSWRDGDGSSLALFDPAADRTFWQIDFDETVELAGRSETGLILEMLDEPDCDRRP